MPESHIFTKLNMSFEDLGVVSDYLSRSSVFQHYKLGDLLGIIKQQLATKCHFAVVKDRKLIGYAGWLDTTIESGELWMANKGLLVRAESDVADAAALTIVEVDNSAHVLPLIRRLRDDRKGKQIFFKREYETKDRKGRKGSVLNVEMRK
ncbi:MAG: hypothetical protein AAFR27_08380 [Pseudomonadota bacterium]